jgi:hypothetical protein
MHTHKAVGTITSAPVAKDNAEIDRRHKPGTEIPDIKTLNPGDHFNPAEVGMSEEEVKRLEDRRVIVPLEGAQQFSDGSQTVGGEPGDVGTIGIKATGGSNRTPGSGATGLGTKQEGPPGIDQTKPK